MIWSIIPEEFLFAVDDPEQGMELIDYCGRQICARSGRVERLFSTDPADYLDPRFAPGALVNKN